MTSQDGNDDAIEAYEEEPPVEVEPRGLEQLPPRQQTVERIAKVYYRGCRHVASAITAIKRRLSDEQQ